MMDARAFREMVFRVLAGIVGNDRKALGAFGPDLMRNLRNSKTAFGRLPAGHGDRVVIEYLVGNVDAGSGAGAGARAARTRPWSASIRLRSATMARRSRRACRPRKDDSRRPHYKECASAGLR